ncbi:MAG: hypothetical protein ACOVSW_12535 [Candidatus Kapaibacteriota bacterium]|jgi:hypothetical protein
MVTAYPTDADISTQFLEIETDALPGDADFMRKRAWKAWESLGKRLRLLGQSPMQPSGDAPQFVRHVENSDGEMQFPQFADCVIARFYNSNDWLVCFWYDQWKEVFQYSEELSEFMSREEFRM